MCSDCGAPISASASRCRACNMRVQRRPRPRMFTGAEKSARWRARHPDRNKATRDRQRQWKREALAALKAEAGCAHCGIDDPRVLDFHHSDAAEKTLAVSQLVNRASWEAVLDEVSRCEVLCANCHRIAHHEDAEVHSPAEAWRSA